MCVFWPGVSKDIANMIEWCEVCQKYQDERCEVCQKYQDKQPREQITSPPILSSPWHTIASNLFEFNGKTYLIGIASSSLYVNFLIIAPSIP